MFGKDKAQVKLLANLEEHFLKVHRAHHLPVGDFPDVTRFRGVMEGHDLSKFPKLDLKLLDSMDTVLTKDIPKLMAMFPQEGTHSNAGNAVSESLAHVGNNLTPPSQPPQIGYSAPSSTVPGYPVAPPPQYQQAPNQQVQYQQPYPPAPPPPGPSPFDAAPPPPAAWVVTPADKERYDQVFTSLNPVNGLASGMAVRPILERSGLPVDVLRQVWNLSDIDRDGNLDADEFAVAMHLAREATAGKTLAPVLPMEMVPPSKR